MQSTPDYSEIETVLKQLLGEKVSFASMVKELTENGSFFDGTKWIEMIGKLCIEQLHANGKTIGYLLLLIISAAVLAALAKAFQSRQISDMGFYMIYLLLLVIILRVFGTCCSLTERVILDLISFMKVLMPTYLMVLASGAYTSSAIVYYEVFFIMIYYIERFVEAILLPAIRCYVLCTLLAYLGEEELFAKGRELLKKAILICLKAMLGITAGIQMFQGMLSPAVDELKHTMVSRGISSLGTIGNVTQNVTDVILGSAVLLKNGIGVAGAVLLVTICLIPAVQTTVYMLFFQILSAVTEPVSDKRVTAIISKAGEGIGLLVKLLFSVCAVFLLIIAIICVTTGGIQ